MKRSLQNCRVLSIGMLLIATPLLSPSVLCVGEDGHVAFETKKLGALNDCGSSRSHALASTPLTDEADCPNHCGECDDYTVSHDRWSPPWQATEKLSHLWVQANAMSVYDAAEQRRGHRTGDPFISRAPPVHQQTLLALRTIVMLS